MLLPLAHQLSAEEVSKLMSALNQACTKDVERQVSSEGRRAQTICLSHFRTLLEKSSQEFGQPEAKQETFQIKIGEVNLKPILEEFDQMLAEETQNLRDKIRKLSIQ